MTDQSLKVVATVKPGSTPDVVRKLEDALAMAKNGEVTGFALAVCTHDDGTGSVYEVGNGSIAGLVCAIERVKLRLLEEDPA